MNNQKNDDDLEHCSDDPKDTPNSISIEESVSVPDHEIDSLIISGFLDEGSYEEEENRICESLKHQITAELEELSATSGQMPQEKERKSSRNIKRVLLVLSIFLGVILLSAAWLIGTNSGRSIIYRIAGDYIYDKTDKDEHIVASAEVKEEIVQQDDPEEITVKPDILPVEVITPIPRSEDYVTNFLVFGVEEIEHAKNTDTIMLASLNRKDSTIKLTSLLRDIYIESASNGPKKLNAIYASSGATGLIEAVEQNFLIKIDGYAYINFEAFEEIVDYLGGIPIELGEAEAHYLNTTNYISEKANRNVTPGWNDLNGNQALGYCRVRRVETLGGANDDYGRTLRQRRVMNALFNRYKSKNIFDLIKITDFCLGYVKTNLTRDQIEAALETIVENRITSMNTLRVPVNGTYEAPRKWNGIDDPLVLDWQANIMELYQFIYLDTEEEAKQAMVPALSEVLIKE